MNKTVQGIFLPPPRHWVGNGFPVQTLFSYNQNGASVSPFLLLDHAGPAEFEPGNEKRGVGAHPHRGFETVTIVYNGEVTHRDSTGAGGTIGPGDVQWMTAAGGLLHEEFHSEAFTRTGGTFDMVQLWVNLPAKHKMDAPRYQALTSDMIRAVTLPDDAGSLRIIAGNFGGVAGAASTHTPMNVWDARVKQGANVSLQFPEGHTLLVLVMEGTLTIGEQSVHAGELVHMSRSGTTWDFTAASDAALLILGGEPIDEPIAGHGPFVMNTRNEIMRAFADFSNGKFGIMATEAA